MEETTRLFSEGRAAAAAQGAAALGAGATLQRVAAGIHRYHTPGSIWPVAIKGDSIYEEPTWLKEEQLEVSDQLACPLVCHVVWAAFGGRPGRATVNLDVALDE